MRSVPALVLCAALSAAAACGGSDDEPGGSGTAGPHRPAGTVALAPLCPQVHVLVDALVVSSPDAQQTFEEQVRRLSDAADTAARTALAPLVDAADALVAAGVGKDFYAARDGIHTAVVAVDRDCVAVGSPILHGGPH